MAPLQSHNGESPPDAGVGMRAVGRESAQGEERSLRAGLLGRLRGPWSKFDAWQRGRVWRRVAVRAVRSVLLIVLLLAVLTPAFEKRVIYLPSRVPGSRAGPAGPPGLSLHEVFIETSDGVRLCAWLADCPGTERTLIYFHGNAGSIYDREDWILALASLRTDVLAVDYRGYGRSEGNPSEQGLYRDAEAAYEYVTRMRGVPPERVMIYGKSLGGGPACELARRFPCAGLILQSVFTSVPDMAATMVPLVPLGWFVWTGFDNLSKVKEITVPKLIVHSRSDEMVPFRMGERLYEEAAEPKEFLALDGAGHNELIHVRRKELLAAFGEFLAETAPSTLSPGRPPR